LKRIAWEGTLQAIRGLARAACETWPLVNVGEQDMDSSATIIITAALVFYSIGVWSERLAGRLKPWHLLFFVLGLVCDSWGTGLMFEYTGGMTFDVHGLTGLIAILLMFVHAAWASVVLIRKDEEAIQNFHKFSVVVWFIWLIPYFSPMFFGMAELG
jgi:uncharacterized repeat protein (TIGR03987 family)